MILIYFYSIDLSYGKLFPLTDHPRTHHPSQGEGRPNQPPVGMPPNMDAEIQKHMKVIHSDENQNSLFFSLADSERHCRHIFSFIVSVPKTSLFKHIDFF